MSQKNDIKTKNLQDLIDEKWMKHALTLATFAEENGEIPVGAVLVKDEKIVAQGWNMSISNHDASAHAEIIAIRKAGEKLNNYRLVDCTLYVTLEPCSMCAGALVHARVSRLVFGASDYKTGAAGSVFNLVQSEELNHQIDVKSGILATLCSDQISAFFRRRRKEKKELKKVQKHSERL